MNELKPLKYRHKLIEILLKNNHIFLILEHLYSIEPQAYIAAGIIRNTVWAYLHDVQYGLNQSEVDIIFYDLQDDGTRSKFIEKHMVKAFPNIQWDITNQALVHQWYRTENGAYIAPLLSIDHALSLWPETATAIAVRLDENHQIEWIAPFGLNDLFELKLRWNQALVSHAVFKQRMQKKKFLEKWPKLELIE